MAQYPTSQWRVEMYLMLRFCLSSYMNLRKVEWSVLVSYWSLFWKQKWGLYKMLISRQLELDCSHPIGGLLLVLFPTNSSMLFQLLPLQLYFWIRGNNSKFICIAGSLSKIKRSTTLSFTLLHNIKNTFILQKQYTLICLEIGNTSPSFTPLCSIIYKDIQLLSSLRCSP